MTMNTSHSKMQLWPKVLAVLNLNHGETIDPNVPRATATATHPTSAGTVTNPSVEAAESEGTWREIAVAKTEADGVNTPARVLTTAAVLGVGKWGISAATVRNESEDFRAKAPTKGGVTTAMELVISVVIVRLPRSTRPSNQQTLGIHLRTDIRVLPILRNIAFRRQGRLRFRITPKDNPLSRVKPLSTPQVRRVNKQPSPDQLRETARGRRSNRCDVPSTN
jgi:hypothetical protein